MTLPQCVLNLLFHRNSSPDSVASERAEMKSPGPSVTARDLAKTLVPLIRCDANDMRETIISGLGHINPVALRWEFIIHYLHGILVYRFIKVAQDLVQEFFSPPVLMHGGLLCVAFRLSVCLSVAIPKVTR